jgi:hypothetical protein
VADADAAGNWIQVLPDGRTVSEPGFEAEANEIAASWGYPNTMQSWLESGDGRRFVDLLHQDVLWDS